MWKVGITAVTAFVATNVDDLLLLVLFFSRKNRDFRLRHIVAGQYIGFLILLAISLMGFAGGLAVPRSWRGLAGLGTMGFGVYKLIVGCRDKTSSVATEMEHLPPPPSVFRGLFNRKTYVVAAATVSYGSDNVATYVPLFANANAKELAVIIGIFLCLLAVWCFIAYKLTHHPAATQVLERCGHVLVPLILIGLGLYIILVNGTLSLLGL
jgi:cadmium resistance protein CadD (predicted permease)